MQINSINYSQQNKPNFTGVSKVIGEKFIGTVDTIGDKKFVEKYLQTIEYRPFKNETKAEILKALKKLSQTEEKVDEFLPNSHSIIYEKNVILGKKLNKNA